MRDRLNNSNNTKIIGINNVKGKDLPLLKQGIGHLCSFIPRFTVKNNSLKCKINRLHGLVSLEVVFIKLNNKIYLKHLDFLMKKLHKIYSLD